MPQTHRATDSPKHGHPSSSNAVTVPIFRQAMGQATRHIVRTFSYSLLVYMARDILVSHLLVHNNTTTVNIAIPNSYLHQWNSSYGEGSFFRHSAVLMHTKTSHFLPQKFHQCKSTLAPRKEGGLHEDKISARNWCCVLGIQETLYGFDRR